MKKLIYIIIGVFQTASEKVDTTAADCDFRQLSCVYGQMSKVFYHQNLMSQSLKCDSASIKCALQGRDTLSALLSMADQILSNVHGGTGIMACIVPVSMRVTLNIEE